MPGNDAYTSLLLSFNTPHDKSFTTWFGDRAQGDTWEEYPTYAAFGNAQIDTAQYKWGTSSALFDGDDRINLTNLNGFWNLWHSGYTQAMTIAMWVKWNDYGVIKTLAGYNDSTDNRWYLRLEYGTLYWFQQAATVTVLNCNGGTIDDNDWHHIAAIRDENGNFGLYIDGQQVADDDWTGSVQYSQTPGTGASIGDYPGGSGGAGHNGWIDDFVMAMDNIYGASPNSGLTDSFTVPTEATKNGPFITQLLDMEGADGSTVWKNKAGAFIEPNGSPAVNTSNPKKYGNASLYADYSPTARIFIDDIDNWTGIQLGTGAFTIDWWFYPDTVVSDHGQWGFYVGATEKFYLYLDYIPGSGDYTLYVIAEDATGINMDPWTITGIDLTASTWHHFALIRGWGGSANSWAFCIDGVVQGTTTESGEMPTGATTTFEIGYSPGISKYAIGQIDEFRVSKGIARWTSSPFTPPTGEFDELPSRLTSIHGVLFASVGDMNGVATEDAEAIIGESLLGDIR